VRWQPTCRTDVLQKRLSSQTRVASTGVKFIAARSSLTLSNHFFLGLPLVRDPSVRPNNAICGNLSAVIRPFMLIKMIQDVNSTLSPDQSVLNFCSAATRLQHLRPKSRLRRSTLPRPVYESSFWTSKEAYETSIIVLSSTDRRLGLMNIHRVTHGMHILKLGGMFAMVVA